MRAEPSEARLAYDVPVEEVVPTAFYVQESLEAPTALAVIHDKLLILNPYSSTAKVHVVDVRSGRLLDAIGRRGSGPREFEWPASIAWLPGDTVVWIADPNQGRITGLSVDSLREGRLSPSHLVTVEGGTFRQILLQSDGDFVADDVSGQATFMRFTPEGEILERFGPAPPDFDDLPASIRGAVFANAVGQRSQDGRLVTAGHWTGSLVVFSADGTEQDSASVPFLFPPLFDVGTSHPDPSMIPLPDTREGYVSVITTEDNILALFSGRRFENAVADQGGWDIHIFGWDGVLQRVLRLPFPVVSLAYDPATESLFASRWGVSPGIVRADFVSAGER